ncbi:MAG: metallophosphatase family protein [Spirosomaceae bacterium]|nr:metallophosphatase family protein [Spirosomataceae bacterium]
MKIVLFLSDTHSFWDEQLTPYALKSDEIWHAGDIGSLEVLDKIKSFGKTIRVVYGNIDSREIRIETVENEVFELEGLRFLMTHIIGKIDNYTARVRELIELYKPHVLLYGHSHQLLVKKDKKGLVLVNPGAAGKQGFHLVKTAFMLTIDNQKISNFELIKLGKK